MIALSLGLFFFVKFSAAADKNEDASDGVGSNGGENGDDDMMVVMTRHRIAAKV